MTFQHNPDIWFWLGILVLTVGMVLAEIRIRRDKNKVLRWGAILLVILSLCALYLTPVMNRIAPSINVIWKSQGASQLVIDSLQEKGLEVIDNINELASRNENVEKVFLLGDGLDEHILQRIPMEMEFIPGELQEGIVDLSHTDAVVDNEFVLQGGTYVRDSIQLSIHGFGSQKSTILTPENPRFSVFFVSSIPGNFQMKMYGLRGNDTLFYETYPVTVKPDPIPKTLILAEFPTFEIRYLKNHLKDRGYPITYHYQVSPENSSSEYHNMDPVRVDRIDKNLLGAYDLLIVTMDRYQKLTNRSQTAIREANEMGSLGILFTGTLADIPLLGPIKQSTELETKFETENKTVYLPGREMVTDGIEVRLDDQIIGRVQVIGLGTIGYSMSDQTYPLLLKGNSDLYGRIWQKLLTELTGVQSSSIFKDIQWPVRQDQETVFRFSSVHKEPQLLFEDQLIPVIERPDRDGLFKGTLWPKKIGWQTIRVLPDSLDFKVYVGSKTSWATMKSRRLQERTSNYLSRRPSITPIEKTIETPLSRWYFFLLFLLSIGYLWLEQRLNG